MIQYVGKKTEVNRNRSGWIQANSFGVSDASGEVEVQVKLPDSPHCPI